VFNKAWEVLLVDDDPDVLAVSKLAMKSFTVYGIPLEIHSCTSKAEAIELFNTKQDLMPTLAVAFIDVVMETDEAGLELCQYIREELKNRIVQLFVRTGQPGIAPERAVIDRYDINGYFSKVETTADKLYSLTKERRAAVLLDGDGDVAPCSGALPRQSRGLPRRAGGADSTGPRRRFRGAGRDTQRIPC
jgi:CheY-like chemotaxis protein